MSRRPRSAEEFMRGMGQVPLADEPEPEPRPPAASAEPAPPSPPAVAALTPSPKAASRKKTRPKRPPQSELKHFGGYLDDATFEKIALLRLRLKKDNSELITMAIEELDRKLNAKRAFGDA